METGSLCPSSWSFLTPLRKYVIYLTLETDINNLVTTHLHSCICEKYYFTSLLCNSLSTPDFPDTTGDQTVLCWMWSEKCNRLDHNLDVTDLAK